MQRVSVSAEAALQAALEECVDRDEARVDFGVWAEAPLLALEEQLQRLGGNLGGISHGES